MTRTLVRILAVSIVLLLSAALGLVRLGGPTHRSVAYPNFACVAVLNYGLCVGPPTTD